MRNAETMRCRILILPALICCGFISSAYAQSSGPDAERPALLVTVLDQSHLAAPGAAVEVNQGGRVIAAALTDAAGQALFPALKPGLYTINVSKEGFDSASARTSEWKTAASQRVELLLKVRSQNESVEVHEVVSAVEAISAPSSSVAGDALKDMPSRPSTVRDALPLIPGIARQPSGALQLSGSGEHRSAMLVNAADVTDPATGAFGLTVPVDVVESINYYQTSFLAEYGRFSAGLVSVETKRGGEARRSFRH